MSRLHPDRLLITYSDLSVYDTSIIPRKYTLTHSDITGRLFLTIGKTYDHGKLKKWYTHFMRDEVLAEWQELEGQTVLAVYCHVSGGFVFGWASLRYRIFSQELPLALESFRYGDSALFSAHPELERSRIEIHFHSTLPRYNLIENRGVCGDYQSENAVANAAILPEITN